MSTRSDYLVLVITTGALFSTMVARIAISPVIPQVVDTFDVSKGLIGFGLTGMWATYALLQFPSGLLGERYGERSVILLALLFTALGSVLIALAPSFPILVLFLVFLGAGAGLYYSVGSTLLTQTFDKVGLALGVHSAGLPIAGLLTPIAVSAVSIRYGWRPAILVGAAVSIPVFVLTAVYWWPTALAPTGPTVLERFDSDEFLLLIRRPPIAFTIAVAIITSYSYQAFTSFFPTFLVEFRQLSLQNAGVAFAAVFIVSAIFLPVLGGLSDRYSRDSVLSFALATTAMGYGTVLYGSTFNSLAFGVILIGVGMSWGGVLHSRIMDNFSNEERGTGFGLVRTVYMLVGSTGSIATGVLADTLGWNAAYGAVMVLLGACSVVVFTIRYLDLNW